MIRCATSVGLAFAVALPAAFAGDPIVADDFDDGVIDDQWIAFELPGTSVVESGGVLGISMPMNPGVDGTGAGVLGDWSLVADCDYALNVDWHAVVPTLPNGDAGLEIALIYEGDLEEGILSGISVYIGSDEDGPYIGYETELDGDKVDAQYFFRDDADGTVALCYDASDDTVSFGLEGSCDFAFIIPGVQDLFGADDVQIVLSAFSEGIAPAIPISDFTYDDFAVADGVLFPGECPNTCPADTDGNGVVDVTDLVAVILDWGTDGTESNGDVDGSGNVDVVDLTTVILAWGPC